MEAIAWFVHKYIMHGPLWFIHKDHHVSKPSVFELNDAFFLIFAIPSALLIVFGAMVESMNWMLYIGSGIAFYGLIYFMLHEVFVHQRLKYFRNIRNDYLIRLRKAHLIHHKAKQKDGAQYFGLLLFVKEK